MFTYRCNIRRSWLDMKGHMNVGPYFETLSEVSDLLCRDLGLGLFYLERGHSVFAGEMQVTYVREVHAGRQNGR